MTLRVMSLFTSTYDEHNINNLFTIYLFIQIGSLSEKFDLIRILHSIEPNSCGNPIFQCDYLLNIVLTINYISNMLMIR